MQRKEKIVKEIKSTALIVILIFAFRSTFFEPFRIPSGSMIPTLMIGDFILVNKFSYGFKVPFSDMFSDPVYVTDFQSPNRGDVIVFKYPKDTSFNYIKRVVGLPGDKIRLDNKRVYVNGQIIDWKPVDSSKYMADMDDNFKQYNFSFYKAKRGETEHILQTTERLMRFDSIEEFEVPPNKFFVMGDNRDFSADSRFWGFVPQENIKGKALFVWFSMIFPFGEHPFKLRLHRIGEVID